MGCELLFLSILDLWKWCFYDSIHPYLLNLTWWCGYGYKLYYKISLFMCNVSVHSACVVLFRHMFLVYVFVCVSEVFVCFLNDKSLLFIKFGFDSKSYRIYINCILNWRKFSPLNYITLHCHLNFKRILWIINYFNCLENS